MTANIITLIRICLTFTLIALFGKNRYIDIAAISTIPLLFGLDAIDGYVARKYKQTNTFGAVWDIAAELKMFFGYTLSVSNSRCQRPLFHPIFQQICISVLVKVRYQQIQVEVLPRTKLIRWKSNLSPDADSILL